ncbi:MFS transporter [Oceanicoccus sagamiensis]|uniref:MFS transporter n=1 Tax=Oceanicoccus sagamiensis TaxID=716816 RepID=A0A1X9N6R2_9GAMM|nr:MFS transporter [Oceanicoccus sagamiensis]ARN73790.1 hypothetical protein BST96_06485 [Oceanicoccus sagamiensis]
MSLPKKTSTTITPLIGIAYALPVAPVLLLMSSNNVLSGIYAKHHGLSLASISIVMLVAGLFDAVTDPAIGYFSDRYHARTGSRRPFVIGGALLLIPCAWFLLNPGESVTIAYFLLWYLLFYLSITLFQIPHLTWGGEISPISEQKNKVYGYRNLGGYMGMMVFMIIPMLPFTEGSEVTPETMRYLVVAAGLLVMPTLFVLLRYVPTGAHYSESLKTTENPFQAIHALMHSRPLLWFLAVSIAYVLAQGFYIGLEFMVMDIWLDMGDYYVYLSLLHLVVASLAVAPAMKIITRLGKIKALRLSIMVFAITVFLLPVVLLKSPYSLHLYAIFQMLYATASALGNIALFSLLSDVSDYNTFKLGIDRSASCFSLQSLVMKSMTAMGIALSIALAGWWGFDPAKTSQPEGAYWGLVLCIGVMPMLLSFVAALCVPGIAITEKRHAVIRRRLDARAERASQYVVQSKSLSGDAVPALK